MAAPVFRTGSLCELLAIAAPLTANGKAAHPDIVATATINNTYRINLSPKNNHNLEPATPNETCKALQKKMLTLGKDECFHEDQYFFGG